MVMTRASYFNSLFNRPFQKIVSAGRRKDVFMLEKKETRRFNSLTPLRMSLPPGIVPAGGTRPSAFGHGSSFIHGQFPAVQRILIKLTGSFLGILFTGHFDESESARATGLCVSHDANRLHTTCLAE
jgi:hypothetical protein